MESVPGPGSRRPRPSIAAAVGVYLLAGVVWIALSSLVADDVAEWIGISAAALEVAKGTAFVAVTGTILYALLRRWERARAQTERAYSIIVEHVQEGLYVFRLPPDHGFEYVNPALERSTGFSAEAFYANPDLAFQRIHPEDTHLMEAARESPATVDWPVELRFRHADGHLVWHEIHESPIRTEDGRITAVQGLATDITHRKKREAALSRALELEEQAAEEHRRASDLKSAFLQAVSHELRTPLTAIRGFAATLAEHGHELSEEKARDLHRRLRQRAEQLDHLLADLLDVERVEQNLLDAHRHEVELGALIRGVAEQVDLRGRGLDLQPGDGPVVEVDTPKMERIVENLLVNAVRHTPEDTRIRVTVENSDDGIVLVVADDGPGIDPDIRGTLFEPFVRGPERDSAASPGTGIGLALVAQFAALHGGRATITDSAMGGAEIRVALPRTTTGPHGGDRGPVRES